MKVSEVLGLIKYNDQNIVINRLVKSEIYEGAFIPREVTEEKTAECWKALIKLGEVKDRDIVSMSSYTTQTNTTNSSEYSSSGIYIKMR